MPFGCASDEQFEFERFSALMESDDDIFDEEIRESKCDYCNCAMRDCSLCDQNVEG